jgi:hypothetical protein
MIRMRSRGDRRALSCPGRGAQRFERILAGFMGADSTPDLAGFTGMGFTGMGSRERLASLVIPNWQSTLLARAVYKPVGADRQSL